MTEQPQFGSPEWQRQAAEAFGRAARQAQEGFQHASRQIGETAQRLQVTLAAQTAMGWAYRGDLDQTRATLAGMSPRPTARTLGRRVDVGDTGRRGAEHQMNDGQRIEHRVHDEIHDCIRPGCGKRAQTAFIAREHGEYGAGLNAEVGRGIRDHLGLNEDGQARG